MNNNISEDYCSFEVSKLLKEKGFAVKGNHAYTTNAKGEFSGRVSSVSYTYIEENGYIYKPTHALAIKWIRENFEISIIVSVLHDEEEEYYYEASCNRKGHMEWSKFLSTYEKATESALLYTLKNLI